MRFLQSSRRDVAAIGVAIALAGCDAARAQGTEPDDGAARLAGVVTVPGDWRPQPAIASAAAQAGGATTGAAAWGEPGVGCFAVVVTARAERQNPEDALEELRAALVADLGLDGWTAVDPTDVRGTIARGGMRGDVRGSIALAPPKGAIVALAACFHNERDPDACRAPCKGVLDSLDASKVKP